MWGLGLVGGYNGSPPSTSQVSLEAKDGEFDLRPNTGTLQAIRAMAVISSVAATAWYGTLAVVIWSQQICFRFLMALPCRISYSSHSVPFVSSIEFHQFPWGTPLLKTSVAVCSCVWWAVLLELPTRDHQSTPKRAHIEEAATRKLVPHSPCVGQKCQYLV
jgi:hypothetical protein